MPTAGDGAADALPQFDCWTGGVLGENEEKRESAHKKGATLGWKGASSISLEEGDSAEGFGVEARAPPLAKTLGLPHE